MLLDCPPLAASNKPFSRLLGFSQVWDAADIQSTSSGFSVLLCTAIIQPPMENSSSFENRVSGLGLGRLKKIQPKNDSKGHKLLV